MALSTVDITVGSLLGFSWLNAVLYGLSLVLYIRYFQTFPHDALWIRIAVVLCFLVDTIVLCGIGAMTYLYSVTNFGNVPYLETQNIGFIIYLSATGLGALVVQTYLSSRIWKLQRSLLLIVPIALCALAGFAGALGTGANIQWVYKSLESRSVGVTKYVILWTVCSAATDIMIAVTLCILLRNLRDQGNHSTQALMTRLTITSIETGSVTAIWAVLVVCTYLADPSSNIETGLAFCLGRVYSLCLLVNLLYRKRSNQQDDDEETYGTRSMNVIRSFKRPEAPGRNNLATSGIYVEKTSAVHYDTNAETASAARDVRLPTRQSRLDSKSLESV